MWTQVKTKLWELEVQNFEVHFGKVLLASERGRISVELERARGKYGQPKNYDILYYAYIVAILNEPITTRTKNKRYS